MEARRIFTDDISTLLERHLHGIRLYVKAKIRHQVIKWPVLFVKLSGIAAIRRTRIQRDPFQ